MALRPILVFHQREDVFVLKVIDLPQAVIGLHARAVLLISRPVFRLHTEPELQAVGSTRAFYQTLWMERNQSGGCRYLENGCCLSHVPPQFGLAVPRVHDCRVSASGVFTGRDGCGVAALRFLGRSVMRQTRSR